MKRSSSEQLELYERSLLGGSPYPAAPPGRSLHEQGRAFDMVGPPQLLAAFGRVWESWGGRWGGRDGSDPIHFEA